MLGQVQVHKQNPSSGFMTQDILYSLGLVLANLNYQKFKYNLRDTINPMCLTNAAVDEAEHFLLICPSFEIQRRDLAGVHPLVRPFGQSNPSNEVLTQLLKCGDNDLSDEIN